MKTYENQPNMIINLLSFPTHSPSLTFVEKYPSQENHPVCCDPVVVINSPLTSHP